jgi:predicted nucleotidyltransferase
MTPFHGACRALTEAGVRFVVIGVWGVNYYARSAGTALATRDVDLFLPTDSHNLLRAWDACRAAGLELWAGDEPLDEPQDLELADAVVAKRALTTAVDDIGTMVDLTMTMSGFSFAEVDAEKHEFKFEGLNVPVARLSHIVRSKASAGRPKDRLFLEVHRELLQSLMRRDRRRRPKTD